MPRGTPVPSRQWASRGNVCGFATFARPDPILFPLSVRETRPSSVSDVARAAAASESLRGLRGRDVSRTNTARAPVSAREVHAFLSTLATPELRHLALDALPVALRGARVLATSPSFANLTRLRLETCAVGPRAAAALAASETLDGLVSLTLKGNKIGSGLAKVANTQTFPRLAHCRLGTGVPRGTHARLCRRPGVRG